MTSPPWIRALFVATALTMAACGGSTATPPANAGSVVLSINGGPALAAVTKVTLSVSPAGVTADLLPDQATGAFAGTLSLPVGLQTITARAYAGATLVAEGSASVTVTGGQALSVTITVLDVTGPEPTPDHAPVLTSLAASAVTLDVGQVLTLSAAATDVDGDVITYTWSAQPAGCATFSPDTTTGGGTASTTATAALAGSCAVSVRAEALGLADTLSTTVDLLLPVVIGGIFVPQPVIASVEFLAPASATVLRTDVDATVRHAWFAGTPVSVRISWDATPWLERSVAALEDGCGGTVVTTAATNTSETFDWTPTGGPVCLLTARVERRGLADALPVAVILGAPLTGQCAWTQVAIHDLSSLPAGAAAAGDGPQGPASVSGRSAWLQSGNWNWLAIPSPFANEDVVAVEADVLVPFVAGSGRHASFFTFNDPTPGSGLGNHGIGTSLTSFDATTASVDWWLSPAPEGTFARRTPASMVLDQWHSYRLEGRRSTCSFRVLLDGVEIDRLASPCDTTGGSISLVGNSMLAVPASVAWSALRMETGTAACAP